MNFLLQADESLRSELEVDVREECEKLGPVDSVKVTEMFQPSIAFLNTLLQIMLKKTSHAVETLHWFVFSAGWVTEMF